MQKTQSGLYGISNRISTTQEHHLILQSNGKTKQNKKKRIERILIHFKHPLTLLVEYASASSEETDRHTV